MLPDNYTIYSVLSVINFLGCSFAVFRMYYYFEPHVVIPRFYATTVVAWIACLMCFAVQQGGSVVYGDVGIAWSAKLSITLFFSASLHFARISSYIRKKTEA